MEKIELKELEDCGELLEDDLQKRNIAPLKNAEGVLKETSKLSEQEMYAKVLNNEITEEMVKTNKWVRLVVDRIKQFNEDKNLVIKACYRQLELNAFKKAKQEAIKQEKDEEWALGYAKGCVIERVEVAIEHCQIVMKKMNISLEEAMDFLEIEDIVRPIIKDKLK